MPRSAANAIDAYLDQRGRIAGPLIRMAASNQRLAPHTLSVYVYRWMICATQSMNRSKENGKRQADDFLCKEIDESYC